MKITMHKLMRVINDNVRADQIEKIIMTFLSTIIAMKKDDELELEFFQIVKLDNYGLFMINYNPEDLSKRFEELNIELSEGGSSES